MTDEHDDDRAGGPHHAAGDDADPLFREVQRVRQWWAWVLVLGVAVLQWAASLQRLVPALAPEELDAGWQAMDAGEWALLAVFGVAVPLLAASLRLEISVTTEQLCARLRPFTTRRVDHDDISRVEKVRYKALMGGGWQPPPPDRGRERTYNLYGTRGVRVHLRGERRTLILGTRADDELAALLSARAGGPDVTDG